MLQQRQRNVTESCKTQQQLSTFYSSCALFVTVVFDNVFNYSKSSTDIYSTLESLGKCSTIRQIFFEGYYFRVSVPQLQESFSIIYALERQNNVWKYSAQVLNTESILLHTFQNAEFWYHDETFGMGQWQFNKSEKERLVLGVTRRLDPSCFLKEIPFGFQWTWQHHCGRLIDNEDNALQCSWSLDITPWSGWGSRGRVPQKSTASWLSHIPYLFDPGYQVLMAHGFVNGWIQWKDQYYPIEHCPVYVEKNWGQSFPKRWFWLQCNCFCGEADLSVTSLGATRRALLEKARGGEETSIYSMGSFSMGYWWVSAESVDYHVELVAYCDCPGHILLGPSREGLQPNTKESLLGYMNIHLTEKSSGCTLVNDYSRVAAVEVGSQDEANLWNQPWKEKIFALPHWWKQLIETFDGKE
eukprot:jgi/Galph1/2257/GphlegSOOS_G963.1